MRFVADIQLYWRSLRPLPRPLVIKAAIGAATLFVLSGGLLLLRPNQAPTPAATLPTLPTIGTEAGETLVLDQKTYTAAELTPNTPLLVRITGVESIAGGSFSYHLSYTGLETGVFNLTDFLVKPNGERLREPVATVTIGSAIPPNARYAAVYTDPPFQSRAVPYRLILLLGTLLWAGCGVFLFWPPKKQVTTNPNVAEPPQHTQDDEADSEGPQTLADLLRPLVEKAANKSISLAEKGRLEQILFEHWGKELELDHLDSLEQLRRIMEHPEAGSLLRTIERWLYQPDSLITPEEINSSLEAYIALPSGPSQKPRTIQPEADTEADTEAKSKSESKTAPPRFSA